jgi:1,4-dihydroxy-2-naphthoate octaprenyltransferase
MMAINNFRDRQTDRRAGKRTLALRVGDAWAQRLPLLFLGGAFLVLPLYGWATDNLGPALALSAGALGLVILKIRPLLVDKPAALNQALKMAAKCHPGFAAAFAVVAIL